MTKAVSVDRLPPVEWKDVPVVTTELLAKVYGTDSKHIQNNYARNSSRFVEGKHYFKLSGSELADLRPSLRGSQISPKARSLILWTERGAARHAKMLETDQAWDVFEQLEDFYFRKPEPSKHDEAEISTVRERTPLYIAAVYAVIRHRLKFPVVYRAINEFAGAASFRSMTKAQVKIAKPFAERVASGAATTQDWQILEEKRSALSGDPVQTKLLGM